MFQAKYINDSLNVDTVDSKMKDSIHIFDNKCINSKQFDVSTALKIGDTLKIIFKTISKL